MIVIFQLENFRFNKQDINITHLNIWSFAELFDAVLVHLYGGDVLPLLHVDVGNVEPHVHEISRRLTNLGNF